MKFIVSKVRIRILFFLVFIVFLGPGTIFGSSKNQISSHDVKITATMNFLGDFAEALLKEHGDVYNIVSGSVDPHFFEPSANDLIHLQDSDVILAIGYEEIDGWLTDFMKDNPDLEPKVFNVIDLDEVLETDPLIDALNPHFWLSPLNALKMVENIKNYFLNEELLDEPTIVKNYLEYEAELKDLINQIEENVSNYNGIKVVVDHPAFFYFLELLGFDRRGAIEEREGVDPSPLHIQELTNLMKSENIELIIASKTQAGSDVDELAANTGAKIAFLTPLPGIEDAENYLDMIKFNLDALENPVEPSTEDSLNYNLIIILTGVSLLAIIRKRAKQTN